MNEQELQELIKAVESYQAGIDPEDNFSIIYHKSYGFVQNWIRGYFHERKAASYDIEDVMQDVYLYMSVHLSALKEPRAFLGWANKIAKGKTEDFFDSKQGQTILRENSPKAESAENDDDDVDSSLIDTLADDRIDNNPERKMSQNVTVEVVREMIDELTDAQKAVIIPSYLYGLKDQEIADQLNINLNTLKSRKKSGMEALYRKKTEFKKRGIEIAIIPFVLLLHVAYRSDEALAATLTAGMAASGITKATLSLGSTGAAEAAGSTAGASGASGAGAAAAETAKTVGATSAAKAAGTGIAVKAAATVAAVAVVAGGVAVYSKSPHTDQQSVPRETTIAVPTVESTIESETTTEVAVEPSIYASIYGPALEDFATRQGVSLEKLWFVMPDLDGDGTLEMLVCEHDEDYHEAFYTAAGGKAQLVTEANIAMNYRNGDGGVYIRAGTYGDTFGESEKVYFLSGSSASLVVSVIPVYGVGEKTEEERRIDQLVPIEENNYSPCIVDSTQEITYEDLMTFSEEELMEALSSSDN